MFTMQMRDNFTLATVVIYNDNCWLQEDLALLLQWVGLQWVGLQMCQRQFTTVARRDFLPHLDDHVLQLRVINVQATCS